MAFVLEHQPNIYCYQLFVTLPTATVVPRVSLEVAPRTEEESNSAERVVTGAVLRVSWTVPSTAEEELSAERALPPTLCFALNCPGVTSESLVAAIESDGEYLHVKVQPPPMPIDAHRLVSLEQQSNERSKLPMPRILETVHCRACGTPLHRGCRGCASAVDVATAVESIGKALHHMDVSSAHADTEEVGKAEVRESETAVECHGNEAEERAREGEHSHCGMEHSHYGIVNVHELPSEHWLEMADLWVCGCCGEGGTRGRFKHFALEEIKAKANVGLLSYSGNYLMLHASYFPAMLPLGAVQKGMAWKPLLCCSCGTTLGMTDRVDGEELVASYKLFFHCITSGSCVGEANWFERFSVESKLAQMVYELAKSRHCFRICVYVTGEREPSLLIRVMNWATSVQASALPEALANELVPVVKLLFVVPEEKSFKAVSDSWCIMGKGKERLDLLPGEAKELRRLLEANAASWPPAMRNAFPGQLLSFLCLDSRPELPRL